MITIYFSGTGNSKYIAQRFSQRMGADCYSIEIEGDIDFAAQLAMHKTVVVCYPVYGSRPPLIMRQFAAKYRDGFAGKKLIIFATQWLFSGDGARAFYDLFPEGHVQVIYAAHFLMPNNVCNLFFLPKASRRSIQKRSDAAEKKLTRICDNIKHNKIKQHGFSTISKFFGGIQGKPWLSGAEGIMQRNLKISSNCNACGLCVMACPIQNLKCSEGKVEHRNKCTICYRCVNLCPKQAITVFFHRKPRWQYKGLEEQL